MSVEERLFALAQQCRQQSGDGFLAAASQLVPRLNSQAPDLHAEIRALAAALSSGAAARIAASPNAEAEAQAIASEIAVRERLSMASVAPALNVARRIGPLGAAPQPPAPAGWAGDSMAVGAAPQAPPAPHYAPPPQYAPGYTPPPAAAPGAQPDAAKKQTYYWIAGAAAAVVAFMYFQNSTPQPQQIQQQQQQEQQQQNDGPRQPPPRSNGPPSEMPLLTPYGPNMPTVQAFSGRDGGQALMFKIPMQDGGSVLSAILAPRTDWQGPLDFSVASPSDPEGRNPPVVIGEATAELSQQEGYPMRLARLQMRRDELGVGNVCLMFRGQQGQRDVQFSGAEFCVADGACSQPYGCGRIQ